MLGVYLKPVDRAELTALLQARSNRPERYRLFREVHRLVDVLEFLRAQANTVQDLRDLTTRFPGNPELNNPADTRPVSRVVRWMESHGVVKRRMLGYQLCWESEDAFGMHVLDLVWGRR
ncbi:MAG: hypothetical protein AAB473_01160 [Patescibacteria group bacterium]